MKRLQSMTKAAFTLIEMLVVIAILAILAALLFPATKYAIEISQRAACAAVQRNLHTLLFQYAADHNNCLPAGYSGTPWVTPLDKGNYLAPHGKYTGEAYCPSTKVSVPSDSPYRRDKTGWKTDYNVNGIVMSSTESKNNLMTISGASVLLYDGGGSAPVGGDAKKEIRRHVGESCLNVIYVDGHVEVNKESSQDFRANQKWTKD